MGMGPNPKPVTRRNALKKGGVALCVGAMGLAGCLGGDGNGDGGGNGNGNGDGGSGGDELEITIATTQPPEHVMVDAITTHFIDEIESETDGRISFNVEAGTLGGTEDNLDAVQAGTVDILSESPEGLAQRFAPEYSFAGDPFVMRDMDHYKSVQEEYLLSDDGLNGILLENGLRLSDSYRYGNRGFTSNTSVTHPDDVQGMKLRLPQYDTWTSVWSEIGAEPTPVAFDELYSALETGVAEASEGPIGQFMATSLYEVQSHFGVTNHLLGVNHFILNDDFYQSLSEDDQELIETTIEEATPEMTDTIFEGEEEDYAAAEEEGTTIVEAEEIDREAFVDAGMPALETLSEEKWAADINDILDM